MGGDATSCGAAVKSHINYGCAPLNPFAYTYNRSYNGSGGVQVIKQPPRSFHYIKAGEGVLSIGAKPYSHIRAAIFPLQLIAEGKNLIVQ
jgi:hypothetical protein